MISWLICRRTCKLFFLNGFKSKKIGAYKMTCQKQINVLNVFLIFKVICMWWTRFYSFANSIRIFFFGSFQRFKWFLVLTKRIAASGNEIDSTIPIVRANELKDGWRGRERNLRSNQAYCSLRNEMERNASNPDQTRQNPRQVSLYYVALFCQRRIFSPGRHYSRELFSYLCVFKANAKKTANKVHALPNQMKLV